MTIGSSTRPFARSADVRSDAVTRRATELLGLYRREILTRSSALVHAYRQVTNVIPLGDVLDYLRRAFRRIEGDAPALAEFVNAHGEVRASLITLIGWTDIIEREAIDRGDFGSAADLYRVRWSGIHLMDVIDAVFDIATIEAGRPEISRETFDIRALADDLLDIISPLVQTSQSTLTVRIASGLNAMSGDVTRTRQLLFNLLSNAAVCTRQGAITLDVRRRDIDGTPFIQFTVTDTGGGITVEEIRRTPGARAQGGTALKTAAAANRLEPIVVWRFCQLLGGRLSFESRSRRGSRFTVLLPSGIRDLPEGPHPAGSSHVQPSLFDTLVPQG